MNERNTIEKQISQYLQEVSYHLDSFTEEEQDEILISLRSHMEDELAKRSEGEPTLEMVQAVLAEMDPPESYAESLPASVEPVSDKKRFSRYSIIGAILLPFGIIMAISLMVPVNATSSSIVDGVTRVSQPSTGTLVMQWFLRLIILPLGILAPFACTALGLLGISDIRKSNGRIIGLPLALFVGLFYPVIIMDGILFILAVWLFDGATYLNIAIAVTILIILLIDFFIIRTALGAVRKPILA